MRKYCTIVAILSFGNVLSKEHTHNSTDVAEAERTENCTVKVLSFSLSLSPILIAKLNFLKKYNDVSVFGRN